VVGCSVGETEVGITVLGMAELGSTLGASLGAELLGSSVGESVGANVGL
jgi:hypothetical protein